MAPLSSHDSLQREPSRGADQWHVWSCVMSQRYKAPRCPAGSSEQISVPGLDASAGGTAVRRKNKTTRRWRPVVLFFSVGFLSRLSLFSFRIFWLNFLDKEIFDFLKSALRASPGILVQTSKCLFKVVWLTSSSWLMDSHFNTQTFVL